MHGTISVSRLFNISIDLVTHFSSPGRFFAVNELKAMLAHILMTYDVKLPENTPRPPNIWFQTTCSPNPYASLLFRKRA